MESKKVFEISLEYVGNGLWYYEDRDTKFFYVPPIEIVGLVSGRLGAQMQMNMSKDLHYRYDIKIWRTDAEQ